MAQRLVHQVAQLLAPDCAPLVLTDGFREYLPALVTHYGEWMQPTHRHAKGSQLKPRWLPRPGLLYAQVVKSYRRRPLVRVTHRVIFGMTETIEAILAKHSWKIHTSFIERLTLDLRQPGAAIWRRVNTLCKHEAGLRQQLAIFQTYHNFVVPQVSLRLPLPEGEAIGENGLLEAVAATNPGHGGRVDGPRMDAKGGAEVPGAPVAAESRGGRVSPH